MPGPARGAARRALFGGALALSWACGGSEFVVGAGSTGDGGAGSDAAAPIDAAPPPHDGSPSPGDASPGDAGAAGDTGVPPADGGDGGPPAAFSCAKMTGAAVLFCSDFDEGVYPWNWGSYPALNGGTNGVDTVSFTSPPASYSATSTILLPTAQTAGADLGKSLSTLAPTLDYSFQMNVRQFDATGHASIPVARLVISPSPSPSYESFDLVVDAKGLHLEQTTVAPDGGPGTVQSNPVHGPLAANAWIRVQMILNRGVTPWTLIVNLDGVQQLNTQTVAQPSDTAIEIDVGLLDVTPPSGANQVDFDNVILRGLP